MSGEGSSELSMYIRKDTIMLMTGTGDVILFTKELLRAEAKAGQQHSISSHMPSQCNIDQARGRLSRS